jgi:hypothetical protein
VHYKKIAKDKMVRYLVEPRNILAEPLGSSEPRLKNTAVERLLNMIAVNVIIPLM